MSLWGTVCDILPRLQGVYGSNKIISEFETLLCSGFESRHKTTINATIRVWNSTFGVSDYQLEYPERLQRILLTLSRIADIQLPSFPTSLETEEPIDQRQPTDLMESQEDIPHVESSNSTFNRLRLV